MPRPDDGFRVNHRLLPGANVVGEEHETAVAVVETHPLDSEPMQEIHRKCMQWYYRERDIQADNRMQMSIDADFYDGDQWDLADAAILEERGQVPLVFNEVAPMVDWLIGTERRARVDWKVLPRSEDDVQLADIKTKVLKYVTDVNRSQFNRSRAFEDAVKVGVGWVDTGVRNDPTKDIIYDKYEDWRNVLWDSMAMETDLSDARYIFRTRWVDKDVAMAMYPARADVIERDVMQTHGVIDQWGEDDFYYQGDSTPSHVGQSDPGGGRGGIAAYDGSQRERIRLIECQFRMPVNAKVVSDGPFKGAFLEMWDSSLLRALGETGGSIVDRVVMRMHVGVMTASHMLAFGPTPMRHNSFSLTPVWCYRRGRDRQPYGVVRRVRDLQMDLNKRASKALHVLSTNQIILEKGAVDDINEAREEADQPDGVMIVNPGKQFQLNRDSEMATGQIQMMTMNAQAIQRNAGISNENLGRQTNAASGEAIKARQLQGSVVTTQPFDNLRASTQSQGQKLLSLVEQWYTDEKVIRLTGDRGGLEWVKVNQPEMQADGTVRFLNDITASAADFVVSEQDYAGTLRQVMFESMNQMASRLPPEVALRLMTLAMEYSDLPNNEMIADAMRRITGDRDPNKPMTPEEQQQMQMQMQAQAEAMQLQQESARAALQEQIAKVREINARAAKLEAEAAEKGAPEDPEAAQRMSDAMNKIRRDADDEIERLRERLAKTQAELANRTLQIDKEADIKLQVAQINADSRERVAEIMKGSNAVLDDVAGQLDALDRLSQIGPEAL